MLCVTLWLSCVLLSWQHQGGRKFCLLWYSWARATRLLTGVQLASCLARLQNTAATYVACLLWLCHCCCLFRLLVAGLRC